MTTKHKPTAVELFRTWNATMRRLQLDPNPTDEMQQDEQQAFDRLIKHVETEHDPR